MMRGYRNLKKAGRLDCIAAVKQELTVQKIGIDGKLFSPLIFGAGLASAELVVRQYLLVRIGGINLNRALLLAAGKPDTRVVFSMPSEWGDVIERHGFEVDRFRSTVLWAMYVTALLLYGCMKIGNTALKSLASVASPCRKLKPYVYFADLVPSNLPQEAQGQPSHNIVSWYLQWDGRKPHIEAIHHSVPKTVCKILGNVDLNTQPAPLPEMVGLSELINYFGWSLSAAVIATLDLLRGRWWHALLLNQVALAAQARVISTDCLAQEYLFHNSNWIYRPLWTYEAERNGSLITFYFYSTNSQYFDNKSNCSPVPYGWKAANWPRYLVWDKYQERFIRDAVGGMGSILVVGEIWFQDSRECALTLSHNSVAVFDVQPLRDSKYQLLGAGYEYYTPDTAVKFLEDIHAVVEELQIDMVFKRKREIYDEAHPSYRSFVNSLSGSSHVVAIPPSISAVRLVEDCACIAVISMPFTSTALLGKFQGKPSVYYDSCAKVVKGDCAAHGIDTLVGKEELRAWLKAVLLKSKVSTNT